MYQLVFTKLHTDNVTFDDEPPKVSTCTAVERMEAMAAAVVNPADAD
jgi:hypothetical protein